MSLNLYANGFLIKCAASVHGGMGSYGLVGWPESNMNFCQSTGRQKVCRQGMCYCWALIVSYVQVDL